MKSVNNVSMDLINAERRAQSTGWSHGHALSSPSEALSKCFVTSGTGNLFRKSNVKTFKWMSLARDPARSDE